MLASVTLPTRVEEPEEAPRARRRGRGRGARGRGRGCGRGRRGSRRRSAPRRADPCACRGAGASVPRRSTCSSSGSATRAASTRATATTSATWSSTSSRAGTAARGAASSPAGLADVRIDEHRVGLLKPETYMNESGRSGAGRGGVLQARAGRDPRRPRRERPRARPAAGAASAAGSPGHNGLRSVAKQLGTPDFMRLRVGVGRPERGDPRPLADYVLSDFEPHEDAERDRRPRRRRGRDARRRGLEATQRAVQLELGLSPRW